ncbi:MAG: PEP-CTERM sorting domain-containing protein [Planctomycetia bacterium]|nr:PEP-CTERM sorting domain-containing protein [Planctomycetia bacterium]
MDHFVGASTDGSLLVGESDNGDVFQWTPASGLEPMNVPDHFTPTNISANGRFLSGYSSLNNSFVPVLLDTIGSSFLVPYLSSGKAGGTALSVSEDGKFVVGSLGFKNPADWIARASEAFRWDAGHGTIGLGDLPGGPFYSRAFDVSGDGSVVVGESISGASAANSPHQNDTEGFYWTDPTGMVGIGDLPGGPFFSVIDAVSADGSIMVGTSISDRAQEAIIYDLKHGMRPLQDVLVDKYGLANELAGWQLESAFDISADGRTVAGMARDPQGHYTAWVVTVPEPSTYALLTIGGAALAVYARQRRHRT